MPAQRWTNCCERIPDGIRPTVVEELVAEAVDPSPVAEDDALSGASQAALTAGPAQPLDASMREAEKANAPL